MTSVSAATHTGTVSTTSSALASESLTSEDMDTWLTLMTAQLQNQDPFDPVDSTEYTAQLAQFSAVEQQVETNELLSELISVFTSSDLASMAEWVGKEVRIAAPVVYKGDPITIMTQSEPTASYAELVVQDAYGNEVTRYVVASGKDEVKWDGTNDSGQQVSWDSYNFLVESYDSNGELVSTSDAETYVEVIEVQRQNDGYALILPDVTAIAADDVSAVRSIG
ncbi:flagellar hook capping FlgD N-terminal domain-containing protein [Aliiruegeria lutimaris]|uniref:Basal-body rod modification protein FlgD n=1 Tax=Aliiruegeria lutimaris TaxID=571298 RepID=A0A1G9JR08_9RHOB|nr:flagellar hook capping FlgD N-terminal domain-containing protein [Aliiruegeria lutimaris]SDL39655.1 flagellar basal-body rod modification protein FlgD [Aliiruegeria lutimaris]